MYLIRFTVFPFIIFHFDHIQRDNLIQCICPEVKLLLFIFLKCKCVVKLKKLIVSSQGREGDSYILGVFSHAISPSQYKSTYPSQTSGAAYYIYKHLLVFHFKAG